MIKYVYDQGGCVGCPTEMGCLGRMCPQCWEYRMTCDRCKEEVEDLFYCDDNPDAQYCRECLDEMYHHITIDNAKDYVTERESYDEY